MRPPALLALLVLTAAQLSNARQLQGFVSGDLSAFNKKGLVQSPAPRLTPLKDEKRCGPEQELRLGPYLARCPHDGCCSFAGFCGNSSTFCGDGCQARYGRCDPASSPSPPPAEPPPPPEDPPVDSPLADTPPEEQPPPAEEPPPTEQPPPVYEPPPVEQPPPAYEPPPQEPPAPVYEPPPQEQPAPAYEPPPQEQPAPQQPAPSGGLTPISPPGNDGIIWGQYAFTGGAVGPPGFAYATYHYYSPDYYTSTLYCADAFNGLLAAGGGHQLLEYPWTAYCNDQGLGPMSQDKCGRHLRATNPATGNVAILTVVDMCGQGGVDIDPVGFNALDGDGAGVRDGHMMLNLEWV